MSALTTYGPGDEATWGPCTGHPMDPRTSDSNDDSTLSDAEADDIATDQLDRCSYTLALWLNEVTPAEPKVEEVAAAGSALDAGDEDAITSGALLALAFNDAARAVRALAVLRDRYRADPATADAVSIRASQLQAEHDKALATAQELAAQRARRAPLWPFPSLDAVQERNRQLAHAAAVRAAQRQQQQRLRECMEALGEAPL